MILDDKGSEHKARVKSVCKGGGQVGWYAKEEYEVSVKVCRQRL